MDQQSPPAFDADRAGTSPALHDPLGRAPFAERLAKSICEMAPQDGFVFALYGPWGSGKTTLLNFITHYVKYRKALDNPWVLEFNPWWFSGREDLTRRFFQELVRVLPGSGSLGEQLRPALVNLCEILSETSLPGVNIHKGFFKFAKQRLGALKDIAAAKDDVRKALLKAGRRILEVIDDIDRLTVDEIRQMFSLVKGVADLPFVTYLLAFDKAVVAKAFEKMPGLNGEAFIEKIVQVPFEIPAVEPHSLFFMLAEHLSKLAVDPTIDLFERERWLPISQEGISPLIKTPREVIRLGNVLLGTYAAVKGEVNFADFVAIEALRLFCPWVYESIRDDPTKFTGQGLKSEEKEPLRKFHDDLLDKLESNQRAATEVILRELFPKFEEARKNISYGWESAQEWKRQRRICSEERFPTYFLLAIPQGSFSRAEMQLIMSRATDPEQFAGELLRLAGEIGPRGISRVHPFLKELDLCSGAEVSLDGIPSIFESFLRVGDDLLRREDTVDPWGSDANMHLISRILCNLLRRVANSRRIELLLKVLAGATAIRVAVRLVSILGDEHGKYSGEPLPQEERLFTEVEVAQLEKGALDRIRASAREESLMDTPELPQVLWRWGDWGSVEEVKDWVGEVIKNDQGLVEFLVKFDPHDVLGAGMSGGHPTFDYSPGGFEDFFEPTEVIDRARKLEQIGSLEGVELLAVKQFIREYEMWERRRQTSRET
jgi:predicted KAP-like P-loop ATPase